MDPTELKRVERYLISKFGNPGLEVRARPRKTDSAEVYLHDEFLGVLYLDEEDGERSYNFQMAILDFDLDELDS